MSTTYMKLRKSAFSLSKGNVRHDQGRGANGGGEQLPKRPVGRAASVQPAVSARKVKAYITTFIPLYIRGPGQVAHDRYESPRPFL